MHLANQHFRLRKKILLITYCRDKAFKISWIPAQLRLCVNQCLFSSSRMALPDQSSSSPRGCSHFPRTFKLEHDIKHVPSQSVGQPPIFQDRHFQGIAWERCMAVCMNGTPHSHDDDKVRALPSHHLHKVVVSQSVTLQRGIVLIIGPEWYDNVLVNIKTSQHQQTCQRTGDY